MKLKFFILPLSCGLVLASCAKIAPEGPGQQPAETSGENVVSVTVAGASDDTKASLGSTSGKTIIAALAAQMDIEGFVLEESVSSLDDSFFAPVTKGTPVYTENFADMFGESGFQAISVWDKTKSPVEKRDDLKGTFIKDSESDVWSCDYGTTKVPAQSLYFFTAPASTPSYIGNMTFNTETKAVSFDVAAANYPATAVAQQDVLFGSADIALGTENSVKFYHPFASVKFRQSNTDDSAQITKIEMTNILASGSCTVTPGSGKSAACCVWTPGTDRKTVSQEYTGRTDYEGDYFAESFYAANADKNLVIDDDTKATTTFNLVPQSFSKNDANPVMVTITYTVGGVEKTAQVNFSNQLDGKSWLAGVMYTYSFKVTDLGVSVEVTDDGGRRLKDIVITNTGNADGYIRVSLSANWTYLTMDPDFSNYEYIIIKSSNPLEEGSFDGKKEGSRNFGENWVVGSDDFIYYTLPVSSGSATESPLFHTYAAPPIEYDPFGGTMELIFDFEVKAQIVSASKVKESWPDAPIGD